MTRYRCVMLDPPWPERGGGRIKRGADRHYPLVNVRDMPAVILRCPRWSLDDNAHGWLWATNNYLADAMRLLGVLGFRYVSCVTWTKTRPGPGGAVLLDRPGLGQYLRGVTEHLLFGVRGRLPATRPGVTGLFASRGRHSAKPVEARRLVEMVSPGPRLELFAREPNDGWDAWGNDPSLA